jgi:spermidine/putrescine transport system substrate-binding protein
MTRREMLRRSGVTVLALGAAPSILAACGGDAAPDAAPDAAETGPPSDADVGGQMDFLSWEGYDLPDPMADWKEEHGVDVNATYISSNDDIPARLAPGGTGFDLTTAYQGNAAYYREVGIMTEIEDASVPNIENLYPEFRDMESFIVDGQRLAVPFNFGTTVLNYDPEFTDEPRSWMDLLEPRFEGKVLVVDDATVNFQLAGHLLGLDVPNFTEEEFEQVVDLMRRFISQARAVSPTYGDVTQALVAGEGAAFFAGWAAMNLFAADAGKEIRSTLPDDGSFSYCNGWVIPPDADNRATALAFINETLEDQVQAETSAYLAEGVVTPGAVDLLDPDFRALYPYENLGEQLEKAPFYDIAPRESDQYVTYDRWLSAWQELKA